MSFRNNLDIVQEVLVLLTGAPATPALRETLLKLRTEHNDWSAVAAYVDAFLGERALAHPEGEAGIIREVAANGLGLTLSDAAVAAILVDLDGAGLHSWSARIAHVITSLKGAAAETLDNRAALGNLLTDNLISTGKAEDYAGPQVLAAVGEWLQGVNHTEQSRVLANAGLDALLERLQDGAILHTAIDGYVSGASVFIDLNANGVMDAGEPATLTDASGNFVFDGDLPAGPLVVSGGTDLATGQPFTGVLTAPAGSLTVTPLTTVVQQLQAADPALSLAAAEALVFAAFDLAPADLSTYDPIVALLDSDASRVDQALALQTQAISSQIVNLMNVAAALVENQDGGNGGSMSVLTALVDSIRTHSNTAPLDLADTDTLDTLIKSALVEAGVIDAQTPASELERLNALSTQAAASLDGINQLTAQAANDFAAGTIASALDAVSDIFKLQTLAQTGLAEAIKDNTSGNLGALVSGYSGDALLTKAAQTSAGVLNTEVELNEGFLTKQDNASEPDPPPPPPPDTTAPVAPGLALASDTGSSNSDLITRNAQVNVSGFESDATWEYSIDNGSNWTAGSGTYVTFTGDGSKSLVVRQTDNAGNVSSSSSALSFILDTTAAAPTLALAADTGSSNSDTITSNGEVNVSGLESGATWQYSTDSGGNWSAGSGTAVTLTGDGSKSLLVRQTDKAGNLSADSAALTFTLDTTVAAPTLALLADTGSSTSDAITSNGQIEVSGLESDAVWEYSTDSGSNWTTGTGTSVTLTGDSSKSLMVRQSDKAGNFSSNSAALAFTLDITASAPSLSLAADTGSSGSDTITSDGLVNISGLETDATWQYSTDSGGIWTTGTGSSVTLTGDGSKSVLVRQTDKAGNTSANSSALTFTLDTTTAAPTLALQADTGSSTNDAFTSNGQVNVSGLESGATWESSTNAGTSWTTGTGTAVTLTGDGSKSLIVRQTDKAGNVSSNSSALGFTFDTTAAAPTLALASDTGSSNSDTITSNGQINVSGLESDATWQYSTDSGTNWTTSTGTTVTLTGDGSKSVIVQQTDKAGNVSSNSVALSFTLDTTAAAPTLALASDTGSSNSDKITNNGQVSVSGLESDATWQYSADSGASWATGTGSSVTLAGDGSKSLLVRQTDKAGNLSPDSSALTFTLDTTAVAPTLALQTDTGSNTSDAITSNGQVNVGGLESGSTWEFSTNAGTSWTIGTGTALIVTGDGSKSVIVRQTDKAGNVSSSSSALSFTLDTTAASPTLALGSDTGSSNSDKITSNGQVSVSGLESGASWEYSINAGTSWTTGTSTALTLSGDGSKSVIVRQTDKAGNVSSSSSALSFTLDSTAAAPTLALAADTGSSNSDKITSNGQVSVSGLESGATWESSTNGGTTWAEATGTAVTLTGDGSKSVIVRQTDKAGNLSSSSTAVSFTLDTGAPVAPTISLASDTGSSSSDGITSNGQLDIAGVEVNASWQYSLDGGSTWNEGAGSSFVVGDVGTYTAHVRQTDLAGNISTSTSVSITLQADLPTLESLVGTNGFRLDGTAGFNVGWSVSSAGDVNGDGFDDVIIGAPIASPNGIGGAGSSYVVFGKASGFDATVTLSSLDGSNGFRLDGDAVGGRFGHSVSSAGDINGDGYDDLVVGAFDNSAAGILFGRASAFNAIVSSTDLTGNNGFRIGGFERFASVSSAGDVNGDGYDDLLLGAYAGLSQSGFTYLLFGGTSGLSSITRIDGFNTYRSGFSVSNVGDFNGDGYDDLIIGAPWADVGVGENAGSSYLVFGRASGFGTTLLLALNAPRFEGIAANDLSGWSVNGAGDINGDGYDDLIIGAAGADVNGISSGSSYVVFGHTSDFSMPFSLASLNGSNGFRLDGVVADDVAGVSVSGAGDLNGDGYDDLIVGADGADPGGRSGAGSAYVVFGKPSGFNATLNLSSITGSSGFQLDGVAAGDVLGMVSEAGDINGDGYDDLILGARGADPNGINAAGSSYVLFGGNFTSAVTYLGDASGSAAAERFVGSNGNDTMIGAGGADVFHGGAGDDLIKVSDLGFHLVDGGNGHDTLALDGSGLSLDLANVWGKISGIETIDITGSGNNTLTLTALDLRNLSDSSNTLTVNGNAGDSLIGVGLWNTDGIVTGGYQTYTVGTAVLKVASAVTVDISLANISLSSLNGSNGFSVGGVASGSLLGRSVRDAGDVNGDGYDDVIIGAYWADPNSNADAGSSYVVFGKSSGFQTTLNLSTLNGSNGFRIDGVAAGDWAGRSVSSAGDINGDGYDDLFIGATSADGPGSGYVVFGKSGAFNATVNLSSLDGSNGFRMDGVGSGDGLGISVSKAGDINADGYEDLIIGADNADPNGNTSAGSSYVVFGAASGFSAALDLASLDGANGIRLDGVAAIDWSGVSVSSAGDINRDGFDDLIIGAHTADPGGKSSAGSSYVVFGKASGFTSPLGLSSLTGSNGFRIDGVTAESRSGRSVSNAGDINGDGYDDLIVGAYLSDPGSRTDAGSSYVVFGQSSGFGSVLALSSINGSNGFRVDGALEGDHSGRSVSGAGDINGDGYDDLIIGASGADPNGNSYAGSTFIVFGKPSFVSGLDLSALNGDQGFRLDGISASNRAGGSVSNAGDVNGDGYDDLIVGADSGGGAGYIIFGDDFSGAVTFVGSAAGTAIAERFVGSDGNDIVSGGGGADSFRTGAGDDTISVTTLNLHKIDGGNGNDNLTLAGGGMHLNLANMRGRIAGIETIDLTGTGNNTLTLTALDLLNLSDTSNTLKVDGNAGDSVWGLANGWTDGGEAGGYRTFTNGAATLLVDVAVATNFQLPSTLDLSALNGSNGFRLDGVAASDLSGYSVSSAGDVNGDGYADLIVGASGADPNGSSSGASYVVFGKASDFAASVALSSLDGSNGFRLDGVAAGNLSGGKVSGAGDVNGDGYADLIVGARGAASNSGASYVVFGKPSGFAASVALSGLDGSNGFKLAGVTASDSAGFSVSSAGDVNGDGYADLIVGALGADPNGSSSGASYVVFGKASGFAASVALSSLDGSNGFRLEGVAASDSSGISVSSAGDVNGDGLADLIVGASAADPNGISSGASYVVFGKASGFTASMALSGLDGSNGFRLDGVSAGDSTGIFVSSAGDVNGDGFGDLIVGASGARPNIFGTGAGYVVFGQASGFTASVALSSLDGSNGFRLDGVSAGDSTGISVSSAGDVNGDGYADLIVGARDADPNGTNSGASYVVFGKPSGFTANVALSSLDDSNGFRLDGVAENDRLGNSVSGAGDVNGDGFSDLIVGTRGASPNSLQSSGASYVVFGSNSTGAVTHPGTSGADILTGTASAERFVSGGGNDTLTGNGGADVFHAGEGNDTIIISTLDFQLVDGGTGTDVLALGGSGLNLVLANVRGRIEGIETINLTGTGNNSLSVTVRDLLNLSESSNTVRVDGNAGDSVSGLAGAGWSDGGIASGYHTYTNGAAILLIGTAVTTDFV